MESANDKMETSEFPSQGWVAKPEVRRKGSKRREICCFSLSLACLQRRKRRLWKQGRSILWAKELLHPWPRAGSSIWRELFLSLFLSGNKKSLL
jgi:hypothetical protein